MDTTLYIISAVAAVLFIWIVVLELRLRRLLRGKNGADLEDLIKKINEDLDNVIKAKAELRQDIEKMRERMRHHVRGIKTVRFNPFKDSGSNQSFATALINDNGDGVVISSIYSRDRVGIYAKPLTALKSDYELSEEEKLAISQSENHNG